MTRKKRLIIGVSTGVCVILILGMGIGLTQTIIRWTVFKPAVAWHFARDFSGPNDYLEREYGIHADKGTFAAKACNPQGRSAIRCRKSHDNRPTIDDAFIGRWEQTSQRLENYLFDQGWEKEWNAGQPIQEIFRKVTDPPADAFDNTSVGVNYVKYHGPLSCRLELAWVEPSKPPYLRVGESCVWSVQLR